MRAHREQEFDSAMLDIYHRAATECNYQPTRFLQMVIENGGLATAKRLLNSPRPAKGLTTLWELGRLDLSMEALVCRPKWRALFAAGEIAEAQNRLVQLDYEIHEE